LIQWWQLEVLALVHQENKRALLSVELEGTATDHKWYPTVRVALKAVIQRANEDLQETVWHLVPVQTIMRKNISDGRLSHWGCMRTICWGSRGLFLGH